MERNNNTCKLIKRIAFCFRNFRNIKARILIATNYFRKQKELPTLQSVIPNNQEHFFNFYYTLFLYSSSFSRQSLYSSSNDSYSSSKPP